MCLFSITDFFFDFDFLAYVICIAYGQGDFNFKIYVGVSLLLTFAVHPHNKSNSVVSIANVCVYYVYLLSIHDIR